MYFLGLKQEARLRLFIPSGGNWVPVETGIVVLGQELWDLRGNPEALIPPSPWNGCPWTSDSVLSSPPFF